MRRYLPSSPQIHGDCDTISNETAWGGYKRKPISYSTGSETQADKYSFLPLDCPFASLAILCLPIWPQAYNLAMEKNAALTRHTTNVVTSTLSLKAAALTIHASGLVAVATTILQTTVRG